MTIPISGWRRSKATRALAFVEQQNRLTLRAFGDAGIRARPRHAGRDLRPAGQHSLSSTAAAACSTISGRTPNNPRGLWRRTTLDEFRKAEPAMGDPARSRPARRGRRRGLGAGRAATLPPARTRARSCACRAAAATPCVLREFDLDDEDFVARRLHAAGGQGRRRTGSTHDTLLLSSAYGEGMATTSGYARTVTAVAARRARRAGAGDLRGATRDHMACLRRIDRTGRPPRGLVRRPARFLRLSTSGSAMRRGARDQARSADRHLDATSIATGWRSSCATPWTIGGRSLSADTVLGISLSAFLAGERDFTIVFEPATAPRAAGLVLDRRQARAVDPRRICGRSSRSARQSAAAGAATTAARACPRSASSTSGASRRR